MNARNLARAAVHATLRAYDRDSIPPTEGTDVSFNQGVYRIDSLRATGDTLRMVTTGVYAESSYTMRLTLFRTTRPFPSVNAAIGIRASPVNFTMTGAQSEVNGNNWSEDGSTLVGSGDLPGVTSMTSADSASILAAGAGRIYGSVAVSKDTSTPNPASYIDEYIANADYIFTSGTVSGNRTFGSSSDPVIVICDSPADTNYSVRFQGNVTGYGILAVRGNLVLGGTFNWYGLVICFGESNSVEFGGNGSPGIVGGLIVAQPGSGSASLTLKGSGNQGKVKYSSASLERARNIDRLRYYTILDWYE